MGSGSDFTAFQDFAGIPSIDMGFNSGRNDPVYHYHSNYDSQTWMDRYGDPTFEYHTTIAKLLALLAVKLVEEPVIPFNATNYAVALSRYLDSVHETSLDTTSPQPLSQHHISRALKGLSRALARLHTAARALDDESASLKSLLSSPSSLDHSAAATLYKDVRRVNDKYKRLERAFLYAAGLEGRSWFKHVVFAPGLWTGYSGATWPGLVESVQRGDGEGLRRWAGICEGAVYGAVGLLEG